MGQPPLATPAATILAIDDDPEARALLSSLLGKDGLGHKVLLAADGEDGLASYRRNEPDIVITDLAMPRLNGVALIEVLGGVFPDSKVIAISGKGPDHLRRARDVGAVATLSKPVQIGELRLAVEEALLLG